MTKSLIFILISCFIGTIHAQDILYSPKWFGPNAGPVQEINNALIPKSTELEVRTDYSYKAGENSQDLLFKIAIPLLAEKVSLKLWSALLEYYNKENGQVKGHSWGDIYVQTRIRLLQETTYKPAVILQSTLKTASGGDFVNRRHYDTPGYYFDLEVGKSFKLNKDILRLTGEIGFLCWETTNSVQNDAPMYGIKIAYQHSELKWENELGGYSGWMNIRNPDYGDQPLNFISRLTYKNWIFMSYSKGIHDYPYDQIALGMHFNLTKLTPKFR